MLILKFTSEFLAVNSCYLISESMPVYQFLPSTESSKNISWESSKRISKTVNVFESTF